MTAPKNPRITIRPEAYQALTIQAALESKQPGDLASDLILDYAQAAQKALRLVAGNKTTKGERDDTNKGEIANKESPIEGEREKPSEGEGTPTDADSTQKIEIFAEKESSTSRIDEPVRKALIFLQEQYAAGHEPTSKQVAEAAEIEPNPLGKKLGKLGIGSKSIRPEGRGSKGVRIYPREHEQLVNDLLQKDKELQP